MAPITDAATWALPGPILIFASNASDRFGGEAVLPLHYFRGLRQRGIDAYLLTHARVREELLGSLNSELRNVRFIEDTLVHRICWHIGTKLPQRLSAAWINVTLELVTQFEARAVAKRMIRELGICIVHQPTPVSPKSPSLFFGLGVPVVIGPMNGGMNYPEGFRARFENALTRILVGFGRLVSNAANIVFPGKLLAARVLVANSRTLRALPLGCKRHVGILVENGVTTAELVVSDHVDRHLRSEPPFFIFVGRLVDWKGVDILLRAFALLPTRSQCILEIVGNGPEISSLKLLCIQLGIEQQVRFQGFLPRQQCLARISQSMALVLPSLYECGGAVVLEAMSVGVPVIATDWGGPPDYLNETCGFLVPPISESQFCRALCDAMNQLFCDPKLRADMGRNAQERVREYFTWDLKIGQIAGEYSELLSGQPIKVLKDADSSPPTIEGHDGASLSREMIH